MSTFSLRPLEFSKSSVRFHGYAVDFRPEQLLRLLGEGKITDGKWHCDLDKDKAKSRLRHALGVYIAQHLRSISGRPLFWVSRPPLIGHTAFGLIDRGTNVIQVRPISGCNLNCVFCSVDEGAQSSTRAADFVVDCELLLSEFDKVASIKDEVEAHIDGEGEPTWYHDIVKLVAGLKQKAKVKTVSMQSNGSLLDKKKISLLEKAGLDRLNLSVHSLDQEKASRICGEGYSVQKIVSVAEDIAASGIELLIAPVWLPKENDADIEEIIEWGDSLGARVAVQNLLHHRFGRNFAKTESFPKFYEKLGQLEKTTGVRTVFGLEELGNRRDRSLPKTMHKGETVDAQVIFPGRLKDSCIAVAKDRLIQVTRELPLESHVKLRILRDKHNIYVASPVKLGV